MEAEQAALPAAARAARTTQVLRDLVATARPMQWQKNLLVFAPLLFSVGSAWRLDAPGEWGPLLASAVGAFVIFSVIASGSYFVNDALDAERDREHRRKRERPVAAGRLSVAAAVTVGATLMVVGIAAGATLNVNFAALALGYAALTFAYSLFLKHVVIVDVLTVACGFALRAIAGAAVIDVPVSPWLFVCTTLGALFIATAKRRQELAFLDAGARSHRSVLGEYTPRFLDEMSSVAASATIVSFALYVVSAENLPSNHAMLVTLPFVIFGVFRYRLIAESQPDQQADELIVRDPPLLIAVLLFASTALGVLALS